jgi:hypothetical protein
VPLGRACSPLIKYAQDPPLLATCEHYIPACDTSHACKIQLAPQVIRLGIPMLASSSG